MSEAVLLVGTKKGLWIGRSDERRERWEFGKPEFLMEGIYATCIDTRGDEPAGLRQRAQRALGTGGLPVRRPRADLDRDPGSGGPLPDRSGRERGAGLADPARAPPTPTWSGPAPSRPRCSGRRTGASRSSWSARCGTTRTVPTGAPASAGRPSTRSCRTRPTVTGSRWRCPPAASTAPRTAVQSWNPAQHRHQGLLLPRPVAGVRPVRAQGGLPPRPARADVRPEPPRRLPLRRRRQHLDLDRRRAAGRLRFPDRGAPARPGDRVRVSADRRRGPDPARTARRGSGVPPTPDGPGPSRAAGLPDEFYAAVMRDAMSADNAEQTGLYFGARDGSVWGSTDDGDSWSEIARHLPDVLSVRAAVV